jgi:hypothetical protein
MIHLPTGEMADAGKMFIELTDPGTQVVARGGVARHTILHHKNKYSIVLRKCLRPVPARVTQL